VVTKVSDLLRAPAGPVDLPAIATNVTPGFTGTGKVDAEAAMERLGPRLALLQEQLYAEGRAGSARSLLLVLQGMDTAGKGATVEHVVGLMNPMGVRYHAFTAPTVEEREHHFLWRVRRRLPPPGIIGAFDRSHYEEVLVARVQRLVPVEQWSRRYDVINRFEAKVSASTRIIKCFLHISEDEQRRRLRARLEDPTKRWKYHPDDIDDHAQWADYQAAYADALERCNTEAAPWYVVPADRKWYRNWAIGEILVEHLRAMGVAWPPPRGWDPDAECARLSGLAAQRA
jgi:PPK2 family polyphosphate:nucleotide phosphotransferase